MGRAPEEAGTATAAILQRLQLAEKLGPKAETNIKIRTRTETKEKRRVIC